MKDKVISIHSRMSVVFLMLLCSIVSMQAQEFTIDAVEQNPFDLTASHSPRADFNGVNCAVVKVKVPLEGCVFEGDYMGQIEHRGGEYIIYFIDGTKKFKIKHNRLKEKEIIFSEWGIPALVSERTYEVRASVPQYLLQGGQPTMQDVGAAYFVMSVTPKEGVSVRIDGISQMVDDGIVQVLLKNGVHTYKVEADGYATQEGSVTMHSEKITRNIVLESVLATLNVSSATTGASIYVNDRYRSSGTWSGPLPAGMYNVSLRKEGYRDASQIIELKERENRSLSFPALVPIYGALNVSYKPVGSSVRIDGKVVGTTPDIFNNLTIGNHEVTVSHTGYKESKHTVRIEENQTVNLSGELTQANQSGDKHTFTVNGISFDMVSVEGGSFTMREISESEEVIVVDIDVDIDADIDADIDEKPAHQVTLSDFMIGKTEVTQALWRAVMGNNPSKFQGDNLPVEQVGWNDCQEFFKKLNELTSGSRPAGMVFRSPTEAEWEYAARGGNKSRDYKYSGSNTIDEVAWYYENSGNSRLYDSTWDYDKLESNKCCTHNVGTKRPNELGLYDMSGNVIEWCYVDYSSGSQTNPEGPSTGYNDDDFGLRGGSWSISAGYCRVSYRYYLIPVDGDSGIGVRVCLGRVLE